MSWHKASVVFVWLIIWVIKFRFGFMEFPILFFAFLEFMNFWSQSGMALAQRIFQKYFRQHCLLSPSCFYRYFFFVCYFWLFFGFNANKTKRKANTRNRKKAPFDGRGRFKEVEQGGGGGAVKVWQAHAFVCKYKNFKAHTLNVFKHALLHTQPHSP